MRKIKQAQLSDLTFIQSLIHFELDKKWSLDGLEKMIKGDHYHVVIVEQDEKSVGFAILMMVEDSADLVSIVIEPKFQSKNIGSGLLDYLFDFLNKNCIKKMALEVAKNNHPAIGFYLKHGFIQKGIRKGYYTIRGKKVDALVFVRE